MASRDTQDDRTPRLLASRHEVLNFTADRAAPHELPLSSSVDGGFTLDFWLCVKEKVPTRKSQYQVPLIVHAGDFRGFRLDFTRDNTLTLTSLSGSENLLLYGYGDKVEAMFRWSDHKDQWHRLTAILDVSGEYHVAKLYIDEVLHGDAKLPRKHLHAIKHTMELGSWTAHTERFIGEMKRIRLYSGVVSFDAMSDPDSILGGHSLCRAMSSMWTQSIFADCQVASEDGKRWPAHRCVLAARSSVLRRMLESEMQEAQGDEPILTLRGTAAVNIEAFLLYLYTDKLPSRDIGWSASDVLVLADMYDVQGMIPLAIQELQDTLSPESVVNAVRVLNKRKANAHIDEAYKRLCRQLGEDAKLREALMDSI